MSPWVIAAATAQVPATIRSETVVYSTGCNVLTPVMVSSDPPIPEISAPIATNMLQISTISGSRAALSITVTPVAVTAAINSVSVAPTLGKSKYTCVPIRPPVGACTTKYPCSLATTAPMRSRPAVCISRPREPMASPPGSATSASPVRATNGPRTAIDALIRRTKS